MDLLIVKLLIYNVKKVIDLSNLVKQIKSVNSEKKLHVVVTAVDYMLKNVIIILASQVLVLTDFI